MGGRGASRFIIFSSKGSFYQRKVKKERKNPGRLTKKWFSREKLQCKNLLKSNELLQSICSDKEGHVVGVDDDDVLHQGQWLRGMRHGYGVRTR